tara:strand:- start:146 stop:517 length:372 start_codon:yes stop_codon:yes gene_type:complete
MRLTKNFNLSEFDCNDGTEMPSELLTNVLELAENLQVLRDFVGVPIKINSAYRSLRYNAIIGGSKRSQHLFAKAADVVIESKSPEQVANIIKALILEGKMKQGGVSAYNTFTHYDIRGHKARW